MAEPRENSLPQTKEVREESKERTSEKAEMKYVVYTKSVAKEGGINEDAVLADQERNVFGVFDGVGGGDSPEVAANWAKDYIEEHAREFDGLSDLETEKKMEELIKRASKEVEIHSKGKRMGTTASLVKIIEKKVVVGNVGDSRVFLVYEGGVLEQVTVDDDEIQSRIEEKRMDEMDGREIQGRFKNIVDKDEFRKGEYELFQLRRNISQYLGHEGVKPRTRAIDISRVIKIIITSDGIHENMTHGEMETIANEEGDVAEKLVNAAKTRSSEKDPKDPSKRHLRASNDDMTALVIEVQLPVKKKKEEFIKEKKKPAKRQRKKRNRPTA